MIVDYKLDWAVDRPGPANKRYLEPNKIIGLVCHSMEGWLAGSLAELDKPDRQASWHLSNALDGTMYQHYPFYQSVWANGNFEANTRFISVESEGVAGTPLNDLQVANMVRLAADLSIWRFNLMRGENLFEHNELATKWSPNAGPTSCPSHRYDEFFALLEEANQDMTETEVRALLAKLVYDGDLVDSTSVLACIAQIVGSEELTYSDTARINAVREAIKALAKEGETNE